MSDKKNIDRLFQEKFKDFEANPAEDLWGNIQARLEDKKRKRVIPFWWKLSGIAVALLIGILITKTVFNDEVKPTIEVVNEENSNQGREKNNSGSNTEFEKGVTNELDNTTEGVTDKEKNNDNTLKSSNPVDGVVTNPNTNNQKSEGEIKSSPIVTNSKSAVAQGKTIKNRSSKSESPSEKSKPSVTESVFEKNETPIAVSKENSNQNTGENPIVQIDNNTTAIVVPKDLNLDGLKGDNKTIIAVKEIENKVNDTAANKSIANNPLEELLEEKEKKSKQ
jgi:hypothetical protein